MRGLLGGLFRGAVSVFKMFTSGPVSWSQTVPTVLMQLLPMIDKAIEFGGYNTKEKFDEYLELLDAATGTDAGAPDLVKGLPAVKEEEFFDHLKEAVRIYGYNKLGVAGFTE